ncbi:MAG: thioredoxin domain-containing protein [Candidatus Diapherotrites archaeon]
MVLFVGSALIVGIFIGLFLPKEPTPMVALDKTQPASNDSDASTANTSETTTKISEADLKAKVKDFIENSDTIFFQTSSLKDNGYSIEITKVEELSADFYTISFNFMKDNKVQAPSQVYASKDGKTIIFGQAMDLKEPIVYVAPPAPEMPKSDKPNIKMFVMSYCPYGQQAEAGLGPAVALLGDKIEFEPHFVIYSNYGSGYPDYCFDKDSKYCSMHGIKELNEDIRQLCIWKYEKAKFWPYVNKINANCKMNEIETCWKTQAEAVGIDTAKIEQCFKDEALTLLETEKALNEKYGVQGSPTILINETEYSGGRAPENYKNAICSAFNTQPDECNQTLGTETGTATGSC